jgi:hypothetical protein
MSQPTDKDTSSELEDLPEELEDYEYELRLADIRDDDDPLDESPDAPWLVAQREARSRRSRSGRKTSSSDWVNDAFEDYLAARSSQTRTRRSRR